MKFATFVVLCALLSVTSASAQHNHQHKGQHGGVVVDAGDYHVEMVAKDATVEIHVSDNDNKPVSITGYKGVAILSVAGKSHRIVLEPADSSRLSGKASGALPAQPKGVVQITPPGGKTFQARFN